MMRIKFYEGEEKKYNFIFFYMTLKLGLLFCGEGKKREEIKKKEAEKRREEIIWINHFCHATICFIFCIKFN